MISNERARQQVMNDVIKMIKSAYRAGFADGWEKSGQGFNGEIGPHSDSDEYNKMVSESLAKYDENYELPE